MPMNVKEELLMGLFEFLDSLIGSVADSIRSGQEVGEWNLKRMSDAQLLEACKKNQERA